MRNIHQDQVTIALQHEYVCRDFGGRAGLFRLYLLFTLIQYSLTNPLRILFSNRISNSRRVPYEEVRLPPTANKRCDLYVDDEVEVLVTF